MRVQVEDIEDVTVISVSDKMVLDKSNAFVTDQELNRIFDAATERGFRKIILDYSHVGSLSTAGVGIILALHRKLMELSGKLVVMGLNKGSTDLLISTHSECIFPVASTHEEAFRILLNGQETRPPEPNTVAKLPASESTDAPHDEAPLKGVLTQEDLRQLDEQGATLEDAIRSIESSWE
jgi:anti-sigma B factor antagonist